MIDKRSAIFLFIFLLMSLQMLLGILQIKRYQKAVRDMFGGVILGIGHRKGILRGGEILILAYSSEEDVVRACRSMRGRTIFASFRDRPELVGLNLQRVREIGLILDARDMGRYRLKHHYNPTTPSKKKGALIQAVEAIDLRLNNSSKSTEGAGMDLSAEGAA